MAQKLMMIALSPTMTEGTIAKWKKAEGEAFASGDLLCEVETDKASMDYEAPSSAVLLKIVVQAGKKAAVGETIAIIGKAGEDPGPLLIEAKAATAAVAPAAAAPAASATSPNPQPAPSAVPAQAPGAPAAYPPSSPLARKVALERQVDIRNLRGSGPAGRVTEKDVLAYAAAPSPKHEATAYGAAVSRAVPSTILPVSGKRAVIARRLGESFFSAPHYYLKKEILAENLYAARASVNAGRTSPISYNAIIIKLAATALAAHPEMNVYWRGDSIEQRTAVDIGLAVALPDGLITPVVRNCPSKGIVQIEAEFAALIEKARSKGLAQDEYEGAGFTLTNLGGFGIDEFTAIINPPASAILAIGAMVKKPVVDADGNIVAARTMTLTLGCDHRTIDGATGARFLADLAAILEDPFRALL